MPQEQQEGDQEESCASWQEEEQEEKKKAGLEDDEVEDPEEKHRLEAEGGDNPEEQRRRGRRSGANPLSPSMTRPSPRRSWRSISLHSARSRTSSSSLHSTTSPRSPSRLTLRPSSCPPSPSSQGRRRARGGTPCTGQVSLGAPCPSGSGEAAGEATRCRRCSSDTMCLPSGTLFHARWLLALRSFLSRTHFIASRYTQEQEPSLPVPCQPVPAVGDDTDAVPAVLQGQQGGHSSRGATSAGGPLQPGAPCRTRPGSCCGPTGTCGSAAPALLMVLFCYCSWSYRVVFSCPEQLLKPSCPSVRRSVGRSIGHFCEKVTFRVL